MKKFEISISWKILGHERKKPLIVQKVVYSSVVQQDLLVPDIKSYHIL